MGTLNTRCVVFYFVTILQLAFNVFAGTYGGGDGSPGNPYKIATVSHLLSLSQSPADSDKCFIMTADINLSNQKFNTSVINSPFKGTFDGNGHKIQNFSIYQARFSYIGLFSSVDKNGQIKRLGVVNCSVSDSDEAPGHSIAVLVGYNSGTITHCYIMGGNVLGSKWSQFLGVLVGQNVGTINQCYARIGTVYGNTYVGGLVGLNHGIINQSYAQVYVQASDDYVGGLVGMNWERGVVYQCYSASTFSRSKYDHVGGLISYNIGSVNYCYWDAQLTFPYVKSSDGGCGRTTAQMKTADTCIGWGGDEVWTVQEGIAYPQLAWENAGGQVINNIPGDFTSPEGVDFLDFAYFAARWLNTNCAASCDCDGADIDESGSIDFADLAIFSEHWLECN